MREMSTQKAYKPKDNKYLPQIKGVIAEMGRVFAE
jgi:hypothetical protein